MKTIFLFLTILFPLWTSAQTKKHAHKQKAQVHKQKPQVQKLPFDNYFSSYNLKPDSAISPFLYSHVYNWVGTRYKYSGDTKKGIDCSGFVSEVYDKVYCIPLSGGSRDIWPKVNPVEKCDLKEGDILFFKIRKGQISHVGVFLGNAKFAHASVKTGVIISDLNEPYYKKYFYKGGRIAGGY